MQKVPLSPPAPLTASFAFGALADSSLRLCKSIRVLFLPFASMPPGLCFFLAVKTKAPSSQKLHRAARNKRLSSTRALLSIVIGGVHGARPALALNLTRYGRSNDTFATCSVDKAIHVCQIGRDSPLRTFKGHSGDVNTIRWDPSGPIFPLRCFALFVN